MKAAGELKLCDAPDQISGLMTRVFRLTTLGDNLFAAVYNHTSQELKKADPFKQSALQKLKESIHVFATMKVRMLRL